MEKGTLKQKAYNTIREKIVGGEYRPETILSESELVEVIGVSRTPIREALSRLEQEGLVNIMPKRGIVIKGLDLRDVQSLFEMRLMVEPYIIRKYGDKINTAKLAVLRDKMLAAHDAGEDALQYKLDSDFHKLIYSTVRNIYVDQIMEQAFDENRRIRVLSGRVSKRLHDSYIEHTAILDNLLEDRYEEAAEAMEHHLRVALESALGKML